MWSDQEEALYQLRRRRRRVFQRLLLVMLAHVVGALEVETYTKHHRVLHILTLSALIASFAGLASVAVLGARWGMSSNAAETWSSAQNRRAGRKDHRVRREQAIRDGTWRPQPP